MKLTTLVVFYLVFVCKTDTVSDIRECLSFPNMTASALVLNTLNATSCMTLRKKPEVVPPEVIPLNVNRSCVNGSHVDVMALFSGHQDCFTARFLFSPQNSSDCSWGHRCYTQRSKRYENNGTLCLLQCRRSERNEDSSLTLELIHGIQSQSMELCGLQLYEDHCAKKLCGRNEVCDDNIDSYSCRCKPDFTGTNCETKTDDCDGNPCENEGTCTDGVNIFTCDCVPGFTGTKCETDVDECISSPCRNGGTCNDGVNGYRCICIPGFTGNRCGQNIGECNSDPCENSGTCNDLVNEFTCSCIPGYTGTTCETEVDECESNPCEFGGTCTDHLNSFTCECVAGFNGSTCDEDIIECDSCPCENGGRCIDLVNRFNCSCPQGFNGIQCETDVNECSSSPCVHGSCNDVVNGFNCDCHAGYTGNLCNAEVDECESDPCENSGTCTDGVNWFLCNCVTGFTGINCQINIDDCATIPCKNGGTCVDGVNAFTCRCAAGYTGTTCDTEADECGSNPCQNGGSCDDAFNTFNCNCVDGFLGDVCDEVNECVSNPCQNERPCRDRLDSYTCECGSDYAGTTCQLDCAGAWNVPTNWTRGNPIVYWNFQSNADFNGAETVDGRICKGIKVELTQYVQLGNFPTACLTNPSTCETNGGSLSLWIKVSNVFGNLINSKPLDGAGFAVRLTYHNNLEYRVKEGDKYAQVIGSHTADSWIHVVIVLMKIDTKQITVYHNMLQQGTGSFDKTQNLVAASEQIVIGNENVPTVSPGSNGNNGSPGNWGGPGFDGDGYGDSDGLDEFDDPDAFGGNGDDVFATTLAPISGSLTVDEMAMWNHALSQNEVARIYRTVD